MTEKFSLSVNGSTHTVTADPDMPLLYALRDGLGLNNPHFGRLHCTSRRSADPLLRHAAVRGRQWHDHNARWPWHPGQATSAADRLDRGAGAAMRLLHQWLAHDRSRIPGDNKKPTDGS